MATRRVISSDKFFDELDKLGDKGNEKHFVSIGYVSAANVKPPQIKKKNPNTNRMNSYDDYTVFQDEGGQEIGALVKITSYRFNWRNRKTVNAEYNAYKDSANAIRKRYGVEPMKSRGDSGYTQGENWGSHGINVYKGKNPQMQGHSYCPQNMYGVTPKSVTYAVGVDGHIIKALSKEQIKPYLKAKGVSDSGLSQLKKMGADEDKIQAYIKEIASLKMSYKNFESSSILWICATINGEKILYLNDRLTRVVNDININTNDFIAVAKERYKKELEQLQEMVNKYKNMIQLTEQQLRRIIKESTKRIISRINKINLSEGMNDHDDNGSYTHFAVSKINGKIVNGWNYGDIDGAELRQMKNDYFTQDLVDYGIDPKQVRILSRKRCLSQGIDPSDDANWANSVDESVRKRRKY